MAIFLSTRYQQALHRYHERKIKGRTLEVSDLILRRTQSTKDKHKLSPPREGSYAVAEVIRPGAYRLKNDNGNVLTNTWNIEQLHRFFPERSVLSFISIQCLLLQCPSPSTLGLGRSGAPRGCDTTPFLLSCSNTFRPNKRASPKRKGIPFL